MAQKAIAKHVLITGSPGVGKTTLIQKVVARLKQNDALHVNGFYTEEVREGRFRKGFDVVQISSTHKGTLARKSCEESIVRKAMPMVGQYYVDVKSFESTALPTLAVKEGLRHLLVIDEIGKMEIFSDTFCKTIEALFELGNVVILATIPISKGKPIQLVNKLKDRADIKLLTSFFDEDIYEKSKTEPWSKKVEKKRIKWFGHLMRLDENTPARKALSVAIIQSKSPRVRPKFTWLELMKKQLQEINLKWEEARQLAKDREKREDILKRKNVTL